MSQVIRYQKFIHRVSHNNITIIQNTNGYQYLQKIQNRDRFVPNIMCYDHVKC